MLIAPIANSQGKSLRLTRNNAGRKMASPISRDKNVVRSRQKARLTALISQFRTVRLIKIPDVPQNMVASITIRTPCIRLDCVCDEVSTNSFNFLDGIVSLLLGFLNPSR